MDMKKAIVFLFTTICFSSVFAYPESEMLKDMEKSKRCAFAARIVLQTLNPSPVTQEEHRKRWGALWLELRQEEDLRKYIPTKEEVATASSAFQTAVEDSEYQSMKQDRRDYLMELSAASCAAMSDKVHGLTR